MKKFINNNLKVIVAFIIGLAISSITVYAINANQITYNNTTVEGALNDLYNKVLPTTNMRYLKIVITKTRSNPAQGAMQIAEFSLFTSNQERYIFPNSTTITATLVGNNGQDFTKIIDNNNNTKYCAGDWGSNENGIDIIQIDFGENQYIDISEYNYYSFYTADDADSRDPATWYLFGSEDGNKYYLLDHKYDYKMTTSRNAQAGLWKIYSWEEYE